MKEIYQRKVDIGQSERTGKADLDRLHLHFQILNLFPFLNNSRQFVSLPPDKIAHFLDLLGTNRRAKRKVHLSDWDNNYC